MQFPNRKLLSIFTKAKIFMLSPAVSENQQGKYWFDIREINLDKFNNREYGLFIIIVRIVPDNFLVIKFDNLNKIMKTESKVEKNSNKKVYSFEITNKFKRIVNKKDKTYTEVELLSSKSEVIKKLKCHNIF